MIDFGLILARLLHYAATTTLAGVSFFPLYAYAGTEPMMLCRWRQRVLLTAAVLALLSGLFWFAFSAANMSGTVADLIDPQVVWAVVRDTAFGGVWIARMLLAIIVVGVTAMPLFSRTIGNQDLIMSVLTAALLASLAGTGHSQIEEGRASVIHVASDAAHLLAASAWLGGLFSLGFILLRQTMTNRKVWSIDLDRVLLRFSGMGYIAVATLIGSGLVNSWFLVGTASGLLETAYGQMLVTKLALFAGMLGLAVSNRFWIVPSLAKAQIDDLTVSTVWAAKLRNHVLSEQLLGLMVLLIVSVLGTMRPAIGQ